MTQALRWNDLEIVIDDRNGAGREVAVEARRADATVWRVVLVRFEGDQLMPRGWLVDTTPDHIVVGTDGEHYRGGTSHEAQEHTLDAAGTIVSRRSTA